MILTSLVAGLPKISMTNFARSKTVMFSHLRRSQQTAPKYFICLGIVSIDEFSLSSIDRTYYFIIFIAQPRSAGGDSLLANDFGLYQSQQSLAASTMSASSGYINPQDISAPTNLDDASRHFRNLHSTTLQSSPVIDSSGVLHIPAFQLSHPIVAGLLEDFVTMTCTILYYTTILQTWPNSEALDTLAMNAINIVLAAYSVHFTSVAEHCKFEFFTSSSRTIINSWSQWLQISSYLFRDGSRIASDSISKKFSKLPVHLCTGST